MKNLVYISKSKLDIYFPQVPRDFLAGSTAKLKFNLGVMSAEFGATAPDTSSDIERLDKLIEYLDSKQLIGTAFENQKPFFRGHLDAGALIDGTRVFLGGEINDFDIKVTICLCASAKHFLGYQETDNDRVTSKTTRISGIESRVFHLNSNTVDFAEVLTKVSSITRDLSEAKHPVEYTFSSEDLLEPHERASYKRLKFLNPMIAALFPSKLRPQGLNFSFHWREFAATVILGPFLAVLCGVGGVRRKLSAMRKLALQKAFDGSTLSTTELDILNGASTVVLSRKGPPKKYEFVARRLLQGPSRSNERVVLASPLYLAIVDRFS